MEPAASLSRLFAGNFAIFVGTTSYSGYIKSHIVPETNQTKNRGLKFSNSAFNPNPYIEFTDIAPSHDSSALQENTRLTNG